MEVEHEFDSKILSIQVNESDTLLAINEFGFKIFLGYKTMKNKNFVNIHNSC